MPANTAATKALAPQVWSGLFDLLIRSAPVRTASLARRGLTPNDSRALFSLDSRSGRSMRSLADEWQCDSSNATFVVNAEHAVTGYPAATRRINDSSKAPTMPTDRRSWI